MLGLAIVLVGCSSTAPRFRPSAEDESRFADRIREELKREDDRSVDLQRATQRLRSRTMSPETLPAGLSRDRVLLDIVGFLGAPYRYGGTAHDGVDCSGFTASVYQGAAGTALPRSARDQFRTGTEVGRSDLRFGDLVFFNTTGVSPSHVGIFIEDDIFAHASVMSGVTLSSLQSTYYSLRFVGARRIIQ